MTARVNRIRVAWQVAGSRSLSGATSARPSLARSAYSLHHHSAHALCRPFCNLSDGTRRNGGVMTRVVCWRSWRAELIFVAPQGYWSVCCGYLTELGALSCSSLQALSLETGNALQRYVNYNGLCQAIAHAMSSSPARLGMQKSIVADIKATVSSVNSACSSTHIDCHKSHIRCVRPGRQALWASNGAASTNGGHGPVVIVQSQVRRTHLFSRAPTTP